MHARIAEPLLVGLPLTPPAERAGGEKPLACQQLLLWRGSGGVFGFPFLELFAHEGSTVTDRLANVASRQMVRDSSLTGAIWIRRFSSLASPVRSAFLTRAAAYRSCERRHGATSTAEPFGRKYLAWIRSGTLRPLRLEWFRLFGDRRQAVTLLPRRTMKSATSPTRSASTWASSLPLSHATKSSSS
jgi:hypothetical protein